MAEIIDPANVTVEQARVLVARYRADDLDRLRNYARHLVKSTSGDMPANRR